jgi:hypothetical protein
LDSIDRISVLNYIPSDDDILQARVRTLAVTEHSFIIDGIKYKYVHYLCSNSFVLFVKEKKFFLFVVQQKICGEIRKEKKLYKNII